MTPPHQSPTGNTPAAARWWIRPTAVSVMNIAAVLIVVTFVIGWSVPVLAVVVAGFAAGTWWFVQQRPRGI